MSSQEFIKISRLLLFMAVMVYAIVVTAVAVVQARDITHMDDLFKAFHGPSQSCPDIGGPDLTRPGLV